MENSNSEDVEFFINRLAEAAHNNSANKGFWDDYRNAITFYRINNPEAGEFIKDLWFAKNLMEASGELGEALEALRNHKKPDWESYERGLVALEKDVDPQLFKEFIKDSPGDEIADCIIRLIQFCSGSGINIGKHIRHKMAYNSTRERLHGKKF